MIVTVHEGETIEVKKDEMAIVFREEGIDTYFSDDQKDEEAIPAWFDLAGAVLAVINHPLLFELAMANYQEQMDAIRKKKESDNATGSLDSERPCKRGI